MEFQSKWLTLHSSLQKCDSVVIQPFENQPNKKGEKTGEQCNSYIETTIFLWATSLLRFHGTVEWAKIEFKAWISNNAQ